MRPGRIIVGLASSLAGTALLVWYISRLGLEQIRASLAPVGAWFAVILALSLLRFLTRAAAWRALMTTPVAVSRALAATIGGDAMGHVTPFGPLVGEPAKALFLSGGQGASGAMAALAAENFFYGVSMAIYISLGGAAMLAAFPLPDALRLIGAGSLVAVAILLSGAAWLAWRKPSLVSAALTSLPLRRLQAAAVRVRTFEIATYGAAGAPCGQLARVAVAQAMFHLLSFLEAWFTLWLLAGASLPLDALVLDAFGRAVNIAFRIVPLRLGIDQAGAGVLAQAIGLDPVTGVALSLVRTARLLVWAVLGIGLVTTRARA